MSLILNQSILARKPKLKVCSNHSKFVQDYPILHNSYYQGTFSRNNKPIVNTRARKDEIKRLAKRLADLKEAGTFGHNAV